MLPNYDKVAKSIRKHGKVQSATPTAMTAGPMPRLQGRHPKTKKEGLGFRVCKLCGFKAVSTGLRLQICWLSDIYDFVRSTADVKYTGQTAPINAGQMGDAVQG